MPITSFDIIVVCCPHFSFFGVVLVSLGDVWVSAFSTGPSPVPSDAGLSAIPERSSYRLYGDILALLSAFFYALYVVLLKVRIGSEARIDMQLFFGYLSSLLLSAPGPHTDS